MTYEEFINEIYTKVRSYPKGWRRGQKIFNAIEELYGDVARKVQFQDDIDCFYDDSKIDKFIEKAWDKLSN